MPGYGSSDRRTDRAHRSRRRPRTLGAVEGGRRITFAPLRPNKLMPGIALTEGALEVSNVDVGETLISRLQMLGEDFETEVEGWQVDRVRDLLKTDALFPRHLLSEGVSDRRPQICSWPCRAGEAGGRADFRGHAGRQHRFIRHSQAHRDAVGAVARLAYRARRQHPSRRAAAAAVGDAAAGLALCRRDRAARRASGRGHHLPGFGDRQRRHRPFPHRGRRPADVGSARKPPGKRGRSALPAPLRAASARSSRSSARSRSPMSSAARSGRPCTACRRSASCVSGLWVASGFGRQGLNTSAMAGQLIARSILWGDERWRLFSPFELVWAGGPTGRVAGQLVGMWGRGSSAAAGALARYRERARARERVREARLAEANRQAGTARAPPPPGRRTRPRRRSRQSRRSGAGLPARAVGEVDRA